MAEDEDDNGVHAPPRLREDDIRAMLEASRKDIEEGRVVPLEPVLARMRQVAERIRRNKLHG